jgi:hypothetical protein
VSAADSETGENEMGRFQVGNPGGPGRPPGSVGGRRRALALLDDLLADESNLAALRDALQTRFDLDPADFWQRFVVPMLPKESKVEFGDETSSAAARLCDEISASIAAERGAKPDASA